MFMQNFSSPASTQTDLDFFDIFSRKFQNFSEERFSEFLKYSILSKKQSMFMSNFSSPASTQTDLDFFFNIFSRNFQKFSEIFRRTLKPFKKNQIWVCSLILQLAMHVHAKFQFSRFYSDWHSWIFDDF
jgi:hypothetical protein